MSNNAPSTCTNTSISSPADRDVGDSDHAPPPEIGRSACRQPKRAARRRKIRIQRQGACRQHRGHSPARVNQIHHHERCPSVLSRHVAQQHHPQQAARRPGQIASTWAWRGDLRPATLWPRRPAAANTEYQRWPASRRTSSATSRQCPIALTPKATSKRTDRTRQFASEAMKKLMPRPTLFPRNMSDHGRRRRVKRHDVHPDAKTAAAPSAPVSSA